MSPTPEWIPWAKPDFWGGERELVLEALGSTWISGGPFVERLEREFARLTQAPHALAVSNGTTAIHLAYLGLELKAGDEIIVPGFAFMAAPNVALHMGVKPVFSEVDRATWCMTAEDAARCITPKTKAIVPVHTYGNVCSMDEINALGKSRGIAIIEDAAESFCSKYKQRQSGAMSTIGTYSFQATKTITTGEGGMVVTHDEQIRDRMALYRSHGMGKTRYWHEVPGHNFRLTNIQAALGCAQLQHLDRIVAERRRVHQTYRKQLEGIAGLEQQSFKPDVDAVLWAMAVRVDPKAFPQGRDSLMDEMKSKGIETRPGFYSAGQLDIYDKPKVPVCDGIARTVISVPSFPTLADEQIARIVAALKSFKR